ncbi:outer membrane lipoprotein LolB [Pseudoduganella violaceinigra]|uniref:outer membrane lipoprotein LolB n=1 Tax=Pseudoduganella violaceinigra TaxID=246602 RepID=UPI000429D47D|nr:outer membrane lipoprotein LolB [Pseudoduganella violaceinigra]
MSFKTLAALAGAAAILCGCATAPSAPPSTAAVAPYAETLSVSGRLNVQYLQDGTQQSVTVRFDWQQDAQHTDVALFDPFGTKVAAIAVTPQGATLRQGGNKAPLSADSIDALSARALGWALPVSGLRGWLQGHATAADGKPWSASPAHNEVTTPDGWHLRYVTWQAGSELPRPLRIDADHPGGGGIQQMALRIVIVE